MKNRVVKVLSGRKGRPRHVRILTPRGEEGELKQEPTVLTPHRWQNSKEGEGEQESTGTDAERQEGGLGEDGERNDAA